MDEYRVLVLDGNYKDYIGYVLFADSIDYALDIAISEAYEDIENGEGYLRYIIVTNGYEEVLYNLLTKELQEYHEDY